MTAYDFKLKKGLDNWCTVQMETEFPGDDFFGPQYITPLSVFHSVYMVQLLVAFAHWQWSS